jgi:hypothetical protein
VLGGWVQWAVYTVSHSYVKDGPGAHEYCAASY